MRGQYCEATINHFSHQHPLHLTNPHPSRTCSACNQTLQTEPLYTCTSPTCTTNFSLHLKCSQLPRRITHPCHHHTHPLSLLPNPNRGFTCHACGNRGDGFAYGCTECGVDIHVVCATLPLVVSHGSHLHQLSLVFSSPYPHSSNGFSCDVCGVIEGAKCWLYRCGLCGFDAHLACATSTMVVAGAPRSMVVAGAPRSSTTTGNLLVNQINNQANQILSQAMMGYGGGGNVNNRLLQTMMGGGGGGGGGVNNQILHAMMGGGGGGGGGGSDLIQALFNGSNGGDGGVDLSSVVGNIGDFGGLMGGGFGGFGF